MKRKDIIKLLKQENEQIEIPPISEKIKNIPIQRVEKSVCKPKQKTSTGIKWNFRIVYAMCSIIFVMVLTGILTTINVVSSQKGHTSYILSINPVICITADKYDNVVGLCSLNDDANLVLSDELFSDVKGQKVSYCVENIIVVVEKTGIFQDYDSTIKIYAINDNKQTTDMKLEEIGTIVKNKLDDIGVKDIQLEKNEMSIYDYKELMGIQSDSKMIDELQNEILSHNKFTNQNNTSNILPETNDDSEKIEPQIEEGKDSVRTLNTKNKKLLRLDI